MKNPLSLFLLCCLAVSASGMGQRKESEQFIFLTNDDTLQIEFHYSAPPEYIARSPTVADEMEKLAERNFEDSILAVLQAFQLPMNYRLIEGNDSPQEDQPVLRISALRWEPNHFNELEAVISVKLMYHGEQNKLGSFTARESVFGLNSRDRLEQTYVAAMTKSLTDMMYVLMQHFPTPAEAEILEPTE